MRKILLFTAIVAVLITACQKEIDWGFGNVADQQLTKVRSISGADTSVVTYSYDNQRRLIGETTVGLSAGTSINGTFVINRNSSGIITTTVQKGDQLTAAGIDSLETKYYYNTTTSQYYAATRSVDIGGFSVLDSAVYTYDANKRITVEKHFFVTGLLPPFQAAENQYTYTASGTNLMSMAQLAISTPGGPLTPLATQTFSFDTKTDPLLLKNEAILLGRLNYYGDNNPINLDYVDATDPTQNFTVGYQFKYNLGNKPDSATATQNPGASITTLKYYYQ